MLKRHERLFIIADVEMFAMLCTYHYTFTTHSMTVWRKRVVCKPSTRNV